MVGKQLGILLSQPPNWMSTEQGSPRLFASDRLRSLRYVEWKIDVSGARVQWNGGRIDADLSPIGAHRRRADLIGNSHAERLNGGSSANGGKPGEGSNEPKAGLAKL
jgi:hypothetical protein